MNTEVDQMCTVEGVAEGVDEEQRTAVGNIVQEFGKWVFLQVSWPNRTLFLQR